MVNERAKKYLALAAMAAFSTVLVGCSSESGADVAAPTTSSASPTTTTVEATTEAPAPITTTEAPPPPPPPPPSVMAPEPAPQTTYAALGGAYYFSSPDGQFQCGIVPLSSRTEAGCQGVTSPVPPAPESCMISWGNGIRVTGEGVAEFMCSGGAVYTSGGEQIDPPLAVGAQIAADGYTCTSTPDGISCANDDTGHGFRIAPDSNEIY
ncbi:hypothetical protein QMK17_08300 [Rhodococcus sp. G-MC3]|uniref:DUF6636 domain-containing protein n=1 Tax=Rhodococcus sp. G-MC3 TaxID=3046209 RepID=UPI0024B95322|nr:DUF6636 domain-containing protein [Rhodococcus sp. G-MC3]MDJ0393332.1 hypothetical protein [Rhodococcus sp. G-MC3]